MQHQENSIRRDFLKNSLKGTLVLGAGLSTLGALAGSAAAAEKEDISKPGDKEPVTSEELFRKGVIGPAELSLITSKMAVEKAEHKDVKEFATFELTEAVAVTTVLKDMDTPVPKPDAKAQAILEKLKSATGAEFDRIYITAQLENHEFLRDHATDYLKSSGKGMAEQHGRHLATLALATFKEHVAICKRISGELKA